MHDAGLGGERPVGRETAIKTQELPGIPKVCQGKVREIFSLDDQLLMVATDRISAFDVILPDAIPSEREGFDPTFCLLV